jgi:hypothetical protein
MKSVHESALVLVAEKPHSAVKTKGGRLAMTWRRMIMRRCSAKEQHPAEP